MHVGKPRPNRARRLFTERLESRELLAVDANFVFDGSIETSFHHYGITPANQDQNPSLLIDPAGPNTGWYLQENPFLVNGGSVDVASTQAGFGGGLRFDVNGSPTRYTAAHGDKVIDLIGTPHEGALNQVIETIPGEEYEVSFWLSSNQENELDANGRLLRHSDRQVDLWWNHQFIARLDAPDMGQWQRHSFRLTATATTTKLGFGGVPTPNSRVAGDGVIQGIPYWNGDPMFGPLLDGVSAVLTVDARDDGVTELPENFEFSSFAKNVVANDSGASQVASARIVSRATNDPGGFPPPSFGSIFAINSPRSGDVFWDSPGGDPMSAFEFLAVGEFAEETIEYEIRTPRAYASPTLGLPDFPNGASDTGRWRVRIVGANDAPDAQDDFISLDEDTSVLSVPPGVLLNDTDVDGDSLTARLVRGARHGSFTVSSLGDFSYTPSAGYSGPDSAVYEVGDGNGGTDRATVNITVNPVNDAPVGHDDHYRVDEDDTLIVVQPGVLVNDTDVDGDTLTARLVRGPSSGSVSLSSSGDFAYTPNANFFGSDAFTYEVADGKGGTDQATVNITVDSVNDAPVAHDDHYSVDEDDTLIVSQPGVLGNDTDVDGDRLSARLVRGPSNGSVSPSALGFFAYTPDANFFGSDAFTYEAADGNGGTDQATVYITVNAINDAPQAHDDHYTVDEDGTLVVVQPGVLGNDDDIEFDRLTARLVRGPSSGSVSLNSSGDFAYTPNANFFGNDAFTYEVADGNGGTDQATVSITVNPVNDAPHARDDHYSVDEDDTLIVVQPGVLGNDTDVDGDSLTARLVRGPANGSMSLSPGGEFSYTPAPGFSGADSAVYEVSDGNGGTDQATVKITVNSVNHDPVAYDDHYSVDEDDTLIVVQPGVLGNDTDVDGDSLTARLVRGPSNGSMSLSPRGEFSYTPAPGFSGADSAVYEVSDGNGGTDQATVKITVNSVNHDPVAYDDHYSVDEDDTLIVVQPGVLGNDTDVDGDSLTARLVRAPSNGSVSLSPGGEFSYTPNPGFSGHDSFSYEANDGNGGSGRATVAITVRPGENHDPRITRLHSSNEDLEHKSEDGFVTIHGGYEDVDPFDRHAVTVDWGDGSPVQTVGVDQDADTFEGGHEYSGGGIFTITVTLDDGNGGSDSRQTTAVVTGVSLIDGQLQVIGTNSADRIHVSGRVGNEIRVYAQLGGRRHRLAFAKHDVHSILLAACGGDDNVVVDKWVTVPVTAWGGDGNDRLVGGSGHDTIDGGAGNDRIHSGVGDDSIIDLYGHNWIWSGLGDDHVSTGNGNDQILTGDGHDSIDAGDGSNRIWSGPGDDLVVTGSGSDHIWSAAGDDTINAGDGRNVVRASHGNDLVTTGAGNDWVSAGSGDDVVEAGDGQNVVKAGDGNDTITTGDGNDRVFGQGHNDSIDVGDGNNKAWGGDGDDLIMSGAGADWLHGGNGNDVILSGAGNDYVNGGGGHNIVVAGAGNDRVLGGAGDDLLIGGDGGDAMWGGNGNDLMIAGPAANQHQLAALDAALSRWRADDLPGALAALGALTDDLDRDLLKGGNGHDELIGGDGDRLNT